jgi:hypothetical protein
VTLEALSSDLGDEVSLASQAFRINSLIFTVDDSTLTLAENTDNDGGGADVALYVNTLDLGAPREMMRIAEMIGNRRGLSVIDVTELCPVFDVSGTAARLAVCTITRIMAAMAKARGEEIDDKIRRTDLVTQETA